MVPRMELPPRAAPAIAHSSPAGGPPPVAAFRSSASIASSVTGFPTDFQPPPPGKIHDAREPPRRLRILRRCSPNGNRALVSKQNSRGRIGDRGELFSPPTPAAAGGGAGAGLGGGRVQAESSPPDSRRESRESAIARAQAPVCPAASGPGNSTRGAPISGQT